MSRSSEVRNAFCRSDFASFAAAAFPTVKPGVEFKPADYLNLICGKLQQVVNGEVRHLIITLPPRGLKSFLASITLPAFILGRDPSRQIMTVSYGRDLSEDLGKERNKLMRSHFYREVFGEVLKPGGSAALVETHKRGGVRATSIDAAATGLGADVLIFDDPQKAQGALSEQIRLKTNAQLEQTFLSRRNDPQTAAVIIVMQRLHEDDFVGHALQLEGMDWDVLNLPAIAEEDEEYAYPTITGMKLFRRSASEPLHPTRFPLVELEATRAAIGESRFATQYQQRPAPAGGGLIKEDWFKRYAKADTPQSFDEVIQSWDTANTTAEWSDWTVCTTWGRLGETIYLLHVHREKLLFPDLVRAATRMAARFNPDVVLIEDRASGTQLLQTLREGGFGKGRPIKPTADKEIRMTNQTALIESGRVWIPSDADWVQDYLRELLVFPNGRFDDQVDSTSQALNYLTTWLEHRGLFETYRRAAGPRSKPPRPDLPYGRLRAPAMNSIYTGTSGREYRPGPDGTVWVPEPECGAAIWFGWERVETYTPGPEHPDWTQMPYINWDPVPSPPAYPFPL